MDKPEALRLADELEEAAGEYWRFQKSTGYGAAAELRRLANVEAQRDALLKVLKDCEIVLRTVAKDDDEFLLARHQVREIRAAIKAVEDTK